MIVSIHAPLRGATQDARLMTSAIQFQSTRPCGARRLPPEPEPEDEEVSIHAPLRGATATLVGDLDQGDVSIHAPLRGATHGTV